MEATLSGLVAIFFFVSVSLILSRHLLRILLGIVIFGNAVNLLIFTAGRLLRETPPVIPEGLLAPIGRVANALPQALILTAIVISFSFFAFLLVLTFRAYQDLGFDETDRLRVAEPEGEPPAAIKLLSAAQEPAAIALSGSIPLGGWLIVAPLILPIAGAAVLTMLRQARGAQATLAGVVLASMAGAEALLLHRVLAEGPAVMTMGGWPPPFGISFTVDALGAGFALVATMVGLVCAYAASEEIDGNGVRYGFFPLLLLTMAGVTGAFLTGDMFNLYVWFEVFVIASLGLMALGSTTKQLDGTLKYGVLTLVGTALFLIATGLLMAASEP